MRKLKGAAGRVMCNWRTAAAFGLLYKLTAVIVLVPLLFGSFALAMRAAGYSYLTQENIGPFFAAPCTILAIAVNVTAASLCLTADICAAIFLLDQSVQGHKVTPAQVLRFAVKCTARALRWRSLLIIPMLLPLALVAHAGFIAVFFVSVSVPAPVMDLLERAPEIPASAAGIMLLITALAVRWRYAPFCFVVEGRTFGEAHRRCLQLGRGSGLRDLAVLLAVQGVHAATGVALLLAATALAKQIGGVLTRATGLGWPGAYAVWLAVVLVLAVSAALSIPAGYGCVGVLYYRRRGSGGETPVHTAAPAGSGPARGSRWRNALMLVCAGALTAGGAALLFPAGTGVLNPDVEYLHTMEVTAHRGASALYPENTMAAFSGARDLGADWIELDVQQSADGQLVVAHDADLKRTTGVNAKIRDLTYEQIAGLDAGAAFSGAYAGERIPLLSEVLAFAAENEMKLNIELKPAGRETGMEKGVVDAIRAAGLEDRCVVTCQSYGMLEKVKAYDESITTVYVMRFLYGNIAALDAADHFSVEAVSVTPSLVSRVHNAGKQLFVWTVNTRRSIEKMIGLNVDNIITDDVDLAKQCVFESRYSGMLEEYIDLLDE